MLAIAFSLVWLCPEPISLDGISVERARAIHGKFVAASFLVAKPSYTLRARTVIGAEDRADGAERTTVLRGRRWDLDQGRRTTVAGLLRVIDHPPAFVNGRFVPSWLEIRVEE